MKQRNFLIYNLSFGAVCKVILCGLFLLMSMTDAEARRRRGSSEVPPCISDECHRPCAIGNTIGGTPGRIQKCVAVGRWEEQSVEESICEDGRIPGGASAASINTATMEFVRGGADVSRQRCWNVRCRNDNRFRATLTEVDLPATCAPCEGNMVYELNTDRRDPTQITFTISRRDGNTPWLRAWVSNAGREFPNHGGQHNNQAATWSVSASVGGAGNQTVSGTGWCGANASSPPTSNLSSGGYCWCRMTAPRLGQWVYLNAISNCASSCAAACRTCPFGSNGRCTSAALLR